MAVYIRHTGSNTVHSVTEDHYDRFLTEVSSIDGQRYAKPGISVITAEEAEELNPQLFGAWDPAVQFTPAELVAQHEFQTKLAEFQQAHEKNRQATRAKG